MALITDPDSLVRSSTLPNLGINGNIFIDPTTKKFYLNSYGLLDDGGVTLQAIYSFFKEEWKTDSTLIAYKFPMEAITPEQFEFIGGWIPGDSTTILYFRNGGFAIKNNNGTSAAEYIGCVTLGSLGTTDQVYYQQSNGGTAININLTGTVNQCIPVLSTKTTADRSADLTYLSGDFNYKNYFKIFVREYQKQYAQSQISDIGVTSFTYQAYRFPLANADDLKITHDDTNVSTNLPYSNMTITYYGSAQSKTIGSNSYNFDIIINGSGATKEQIYEFVQWSLRQNTDIDDGAGNVIGKTADSLLKFVGDTLVTSEGVFVENISATDINFYEFYDNTNTKRVYPYVAAGTLGFNSNLVDDGNAIYKLFYTNTFGTASPIIVKDKDDNNIAGTITSSTVSFTYDYDGDAEGGAAGTDKGVTLVAIGLNKAQYVSATGTISKSNSNNISAVAALERNYVNQ